MASRNQGRRDRPPSRGRNAGATPPLQISAQAPPNVRYSYTETPMEMHGPQFDHLLSSPTNSTIEESPTSPASPSKMLPAYSHDDHQTPITVEKGHVQSLREPHPAFFAPYTDESQSPQQPHSSAPPVQPERETSSQSLQTDPALGPITLTSPGGTTSSPAMPTIQSPIRQDTQQIIEPDSHFPAPPLQSPHIDDSTHRPGQLTAAKSAAKSQRQWKHGLCDPSPVCCTALFCPCVVYGKTMYRLSRKTAKQDASDLLGYESCNGSCSLMALACGFQWPLTMIQRMRVRKLYEIEGGLGEDCFNSFCCYCCVLAQDEREIKEREEEDMRRFGGGTASGTAYASPLGMAYAPPPR